MFPNIAIVVFFLDIKMSCKLFRKSFPVLSMLVQVMKIEVKIQMAINKTQSASENIPVNIC